VGDVFGHFTFPDFDEHPWKYEATKDHQHRLSTQLPDEASPRHIVLTRCEFDSLQRAGAIRIDGDTGLAYVLALPRSEWRRWTVESINPEDGLITFSSIAGKHNATPDTLKQLARQRWVVLLKGGVS